MVARWKAFGRSHGDSKSGWLFDEIHGKPTISRQSYKIVVGNKTGMQSPVGANGQASCEGSSTRHIPYVHNLISFLHNNIDLSTFNL